MRKYANNNANSNMTKRCWSVEEILNALKADKDFDEPFADGSDEEFEELQAGNNI